MATKVGVCAIQGDFERHFQVLSQIDGVDPVEVRTGEELSQVERLILPGGESTTVGMLMRRFGLGDAICARVASGMPIWGTCMGMILLAKSIEGRPDQWTLGVLDVEVRRNAFGAQVHSFECEVQTDLFEEPLTAVFIRAPIVTRMGPSVRDLAKLDGQVVAVQQGHVVGTSFHPELTGDRRLHEWFVSVPHGG